MRAHLARTDDELVTVAPVLARVPDFAALIAPGTKLIFDLSSLKFVDSSGLGALLSCLRQLNSSGGVLKLYAMVKPVRALFELVRMHRVFEIFNTQEEAIRSCNGDVTSAATFGD